MTSAIARPGARRKFWGWGLEGDGLSRGELEELGVTFARRLGIGGVRLQDPPRAEELDLRARACPRPRRSARPSAQIRTTGPRTRTGDRFVTSCVRLVATTRTRPTSSRSRVTSAT